MKKAYPRFDVAGVTFSKKPDRAAEVLLTRGQRRVERAFDPYTGKDLGLIGTDEPQVMIWLVKFHDDLLAGHTGRLYNGVGAILVTVLCATGILIWWPGVTRWWRSLILRRRVGWARFNWDLHSAVGFWMFAFVLMWGISGIYLSFPEPFTNVVDYLQPLDGNSRRDEDRRRSARVACTDPLRPGLRHLGQMAVDASRIRSGHPVPDRRNHVVEPRAEAGHAQEQATERPEPRRPKSPA